ncbi:MAG: glucokinase [Desulfuromonas sp.]|nr:MAG: glucokinase [Desulfuromonas sp.]
MIVLAGDIGGTSSRFQWCVAEGECSEKQVLRYSSGDFSSFAALLNQVLADTGLERVDVACFGLPGPIDGLRVDLTNLPWRIDAEELVRDLPLTRVLLINDFQAAALGIDQVAADGLLCLHTAEADPEGNRLVVGAGTGFGVAPVCRIGGSHRPQPSEGGHIAFAPANADQVQLLLWFQRRFGYVAYEDLLSGEGLVRIYAFCAERGGDDVPEGLTPAQIPVLAEEGDVVAVSALMFFVSIYGQLVGDLALVWPARGGVYIAGGIGARIVRWMRSPLFTDAYLAKDRMSHLVEKLPVYLVLDDLVGLKGALQLARQAAVAE